MINKRRLLVFACLAAVTLLLVVGILIVFPGDLDIAKPKIVRLQLRELGDAIEFYVKMEGRPPTVNEGLGALVAPSSGAPPFLRTLPVDPWGSPFVYSVEKLPDRWKIRISSLGPDGVAGTADDVVLSREITVPAATPP